MRLVSSSLMRWTMLAAVAIGAAAARADDFFEAKIRPVLIEHCYECHSVTDKSDAVKGGLRLDWAGGLSTGGDSGPAISTQVPADSLLLSALRYEDIEMPPAGKLPAEIIANFEQWVAAGAKDPRQSPPSAIEPTPQLTSPLETELWSFQPVSRPVVPQSDSLWPQTPIDQFIIAQLKSLDLSPLEDADAGTRLRRLAFDLTGLPPAIEDVFRLQQSPGGFDWDAYLEKLLHSKAYSEHWARRWLDVARYADSNGGDFNATFHDAWRYRNYVIDAFADDMPFDQFVTEQLAGDLLPATSDTQRHRQLVATGFLAMGAKMLSERDKDKLQLDVVDEQISTMGTAFLGMTLGCARCHDHKFDPIPTADYYALAGIFKSTEILQGEIQKYVSNWIRPALPIEPQHSAALADYASRLETLKAEIVETEKLIQTETLALEAHGSAGIVVDDAQAELVGSWKKSTYSQPFVGVGYIHDENSGKGEKSATFRTRLPEPGRYEVWAAFQGGESRSANVPVAIFHADGVAQLELNQQKKASENKLHESLGTYLFSASEDAVVVVTTQGTSGFVIIDALRFVPQDPAGKASVPTAAQREPPASLIAAKQRLESLNVELSDLQKSAPAPAPTALAARDAQDIGDCAICIRGEPHLKGKVVARGFLSKIHIPRSTVEFSDKSSGRLELARWIAAADHPLTARVYVNRVWHHLIGVGLVPSVDNFGHQGQRPTHPELLDYLASEFVRHDWSTKWLVREIVSSHVYRLDSRSDAEREQTDPENLYLWRAHRKRLSAESIRDTLLAATGDIDHSLAESPVSELGTLVTQNSPNDEGYSAKIALRRTVYLPVIRNELPSLMRVFDFADPDYGTGDRDETTVPSQALWMLNSPEIRDGAKKLAELLRDDSSHTSQRLEYLYARTLGRLPTPGELEIGIRFVEVPLDQRDRSVELERWSDLVHAVVASSAFRMTD